MKIDLAISPCPNDTFTFYHLTRTGLKGRPLAAVFADVEELNRRAVKEQRHIITKLSYAVIPHVQEHYEVLNAGSALGYNCGPIWISYNKMSIEQALSKMKSVAVPGSWTTANALLRLFLKEKGCNIKDIEFIPMGYDKIIPSLLNGEIDFGVIIHEERFSFAKQGLHTVQDLGTWWEKTTNLPIPLGCIALRRDFLKEYRAAVEEGIRTSLRNARQNPASVLPFVKSHAQTLDTELIHAHIALYVNDFTLNLGIEGKRAVEELFTRLQ